MKLGTGVGDRHIQNMAACCTRCLCCTYNGWPDFHIACPIFARGGSFADSLGGMLYLMRALNEEKIDYNYEVAEFAYTCAGCGLCDRCYVLSIFDQTIKPSDHIRLLRSEMVKRDILPEKIRRLQHQLVQESDCAKPEDCTRAEQPDDAPDMVLYVQRSRNESEKQISSAVANLLGKIDKPMASYTEAGPCGSTFYDFGFWDQLLPTVKANRERMRGMEDKVFVFTNPHCQEFIVNRYEEFAADYREIKSRHLSEIVSEALKSGALKSKRNEKVRACYHDPCYLGRGLGMYDAPREILSSLDGVELVEMERNRKSSFCCGARALGNYHPNMAQETAKERIEEFRATGADLLITACPACRENFRKAMPDAEKDNVKDLFVLVDERV